MKEKKFIKPLLGIGCVAFLLFVALIGLYLDSQSPDPILGIFPPAETTEVQTESVPEGETQDTQGATAPNTADPTSDTSGASTESTDSTTESSRPSAEDPTTKPTNPSGDDPTADPTEPTTDSTEPTGEDPTRPTLPPSEDPTEPTGLSLPYSIEEYDLVIEKLAPYEGMYVEDGSNAQDITAAMLMVRNDSESPVEYAQLTVQCGGETLTFDISALPAGARVVVQEKTGKQMPSGDIQSINTVVAQQAQQEMSEDQVRVTDNGNNTLTIQNLTDKTIPTVRVFYKYYMEDEGIYVGGIAFTVRITRLGAGASVTIQPSHYTSSTSRVVMVLTYDSEV